MSSSVSKPAAVAPASYAIPSDGMPGAALLAASVRDVLLRINDVCAITGLSVPTIYRLMGRNSFPRPLKITSTARAWKLSEIMAWVESREHTHPQTMASEHPKVNEHPQPDAASQSKKGTM